MAWLILQIGFIGTYIYGLALSLKYNFRISLYPQKRFNSDAIVLLSLKYKVVSSIILAWRKTHNIKFYLIKLKNSVLIQGFFFFVK